MESKELQATVAAAKAGSRQAYAALLEAYGPRLYGYFLRAGGNHHDAEDMLGEMMLRLVQNLKRYDDRGRFEPWLFRIAANMLRDRFRRGRASPPGMSLSAEDDEGSSMAERLPGPAPAVDATVLAAEASAELHEALAKLDEMTRQMILLRHFGQMSFREIADWLGCPMGTVLAKVHRGLKALRQMMDVDDDAG